MGKHAGGRKWQNWSSAPHGDTGGRRGGYIVCGKCDDSWIWTSKLKSQRCCSRCGSPFEGNKKSDTADGGNEAAGAANAADGKTTLDGKDPTEFQLALLSLASSR